MLAQATSSTSATTTSIVRSGRSYRRPAVAGTKCRPRRTRARGERLLQAGARVGRRGCAAAARAGPRSPSRATALVQAQRHEQLDGRGSPGARGRGSRRSGRAEARHRTRPTSSPKNSGGRTPTMVNGPLDDQRRPAMSRLAAEAALPQPVADDRHRTIRSAAGTSSAAVNVRPNARDAERVEEVAVDEQAIDRFRSPPRARSNRSTTMRARHRTPDSRGVRSLAPARCRSHIARFQPAPAVSPRAAPTPL